MADDPEARLARQLDFLIEIDALKDVLRRSYILSGERRENSAEHSWHVAMLALTLSEHADATIDPLRVARMLMLHDIVEIDTDDVFLYDTEARERKAVEERRAAERIFGLLPEDQGGDFLELWLEYEAKETPDARFAGALDRLMPLLHNLLTEGRTWREHGVRPEQVLEKNAVIEKGSKRLWAEAKRRIEAAKADGLFR